MTLKELQPQLFEEFHRILKNDKMSHAYLFSGDFGSFDFAIYLTQSRFCQNLNDSLPCGNCRECRLIAENDFSDVKLIKPSGQVIKTATIRELMQDFSRSGFEGTTQVFIIQDCDKMHVNAGNSLLKAIEDPQSSFYIILLTNDESKVLPTIKSRTQIFRFPKNRILLINQAKRFGVLETQADILSELAKTPQHLEELLQNKRILNVIQACHRFTTILFEDEMKAYLEIGRLMQVALDKSDQELIFHLLPLFLEKKWQDKKSLRYLEKSYQIHQMWQKNVSFQNALEYMVIS